MQKKLSLRSAALISTNIMLGSGIFINTVILAKLIGPLSPLAYIIVAILIAPLILAISQLMRLTKSGGTFYDFGSILSPYFGFLATWGYFIGKLATCALAIHICMSLLQNIILPLMSIPTIILDLSTIALFTIFNRFNLQMGKSVQMYFIIFKIVPIFFAIFSGLFLLFNNLSSINNFSNNILPWTSIPATIPLVLYAFAGFEASCSLSNSIENHEKNGPKAILISYFIVIIIVTAYQTLFYSSLGNILSNLSGYQEAFPALLNQLFSNDTVNYSQIKNILKSILHIGIASSALGAAYGIMYSNSWNLYKLAINNHVPFSNILKKLNKHSIPFNCIIVESVLIIIYTILSLNKQVSLQQISALGSIISYTISAFALFYIDKSLLSILSIFSCLSFISSFIFSINSNGISLLLILFISILLIGSLTFIKYQHRK